MLTTRSMLIGALTLTAGTTVVFPTALPDRGSQTRGQPPRSYDQEIGSIADSAAGKRSHDINIPPRSRGPAITLEMNANPTVDFKAYAATVVATLQYLEGYWSETLPATFKTEYKRPARIYAYAPTADMGIPCDGIAPSKGNAQYCIREDTIQWDEQSLLIPGNKLLVPGAVRNEPDGDLQTPAPASKAAAAAKTNLAPMCEVIFDNFVNLLVAVAIDDKLVGLVPPYGQLDASTRPGSRTLEGLAEYSDGTMGTFGPQTVNVPRRVASASNYVPSPGYFLAEMDLIERRSLGCATSANSSTIPEDTRVSAERARSGPENGQPAKHRGLRRRGPG